MTRNVNIGEIPILQTRDSQQMIDEIVGMLSQGRQPLQQIAEPNRPAQTQEKSMSFSQAFKQARAAGKNVFEWNGKKYTTEIKGTAHGGSTSSSGANSKSSNNTSGTQTKRTSPRASTNDQQSVRTSGQPRFLTPNDAIISDVLGIGSTISRANAQSGHIYNGGMIPAVTVVGTRPSSKRSSLDRYLSEDAVRQQKLDRAAGAFAGQNRENAQRQRQRVSQFFSNLF